MQSNGLLSSVQSLALMRTFQHTFLNTDHVQRTFLSLGSTSDLRSPSFSVFFYCHTPEVPGLANRVHGSSVLSNYEDGIQSLQIPQRDRLVSSAFLLPM